MPAEFDAVALYRALDARRTAEDLSWQGLTEQVWAQSDELNALLDEHPISPATLSGMARRGAVSCQHALFVLRWLDAAPEDFVPGAAVHAPLPRADAAHRLRWDLARLAEDVDARRRAQGMTWAQAAEELRCTPHQLAGLRRVSFAIGMRLAMRLTAWLGRPAADYVVTTTW